MFKCDLTHGNFNSIVKMENLKLVNNRNTIFIFQKKVPISNRMMLVLNMLWHPLGFEPTWRVKSKRSSSLPFQPQYSLWTIISMATSSKLLAMPPEPPSALPSWQKSSKMTLTSWMYHSPCHHWQKTMDGPSGKLAWQHRATQNIIPILNEAANIVGKVIPKFIGKFADMAFCVLTLNVMVIDLTYHLKKERCHQEGDKACVREPSQGCPRLHWELACLLWL